MENAEHVSKTIIRKEDVLKSIEQAFSLRKAGLCYVDDIICVNLFNFEKAIGYIREKSELKYMSRVSMYMTASYIISAATHGKIGEALAWTYEMVSQCKDEIELQDLRVLHMVFNAMHSAFRANIPSKEVAMVKIDSDLIKLV